MSAILVNKVARFIGLAILLILVSTVEVLKATATDSIIGNADFSQMIFAADDYDTIDLTGLTVEVYGRPLTINKSVTITGGTIRRACTNVTQLKSDSENGAVSITVDNTYPLDNNTFINVPN